MSLMMYGYVQPGGHIQGGKILIPATDLPGFDPEDAFAETPLSDAELYGNYLISF